MLECSEYLRVCWSFLNTLVLSHAWLMLLGFTAPFRQALQISPFTLDDFINALHHDTLDPRCILLGEIHSVLTNNIAAEGHGLPANLKASVDSIPLLAATVEDTDGMSVAKREMWVNAALDYSRGWDRKARPRAADGRKGWERHLLGILTQKGGLEAIPSLPTIFKHLFTDEDYVSEPEEELPEKEEAEEKKVSIEANGNGDVDMKDDEVKDEASSPKPVKQSSPAASMKRESSVSSEVGQETAVPEPVAETKDELAEDDDDDEEEDQMELDSSDADPAAVGNSSSSFFQKRTKKPRFAGSDHPDPELRYLSLSLEHKLDILSFLCQINLQSKVVKAFIDDCETRLTEERKEKAEINKEKKELLAEKNALTKPKVKTETQDGATPSSIVAGNDDAASNVNGNGAAPPVATALLSAPLRLDIDPSSSAAPSEAGDSAMPDEPPSRQPSSSPLPELDDSSSTHSLTAKDGEANTVDEADETNLRSDMPDDTSELADAEEEKDEMEEEEDEVEEAEVEDTKSADGGDEQDELDVGSDVDELQSSVDENEESKPDTSTVEKAAPKGPGKGWRKGKGAAGTGGKKGSKPSVDRKTEIEQELEMNAKKDDLFERDWRRFREVARIRPLGKDRFYQRVCTFSRVT